jgi:hypothetical protein
VAAAVVAAVVTGCGQSNFENLVTDKFDGGKLIALNWWTGTNTSSVGISVDAYAEVPDQTAGTLDINGPQHWRCSGVFTAPSYVPATGGLFESDQDRKRDSIVGLPKMAGGFAGPPGTYRVTIELPSLAAKFGHTWNFQGPETPLGALQLYDNNPACVEVVDTLVLQRALADQYLSRLQRVLSMASSDTRYHTTSSPIRTQLQTLLDQAKQAKVSGDGRADPAERNADYTSAAATLMKMAQLARDSDPPPNPPWQLGPADLANITSLATNAATLLSQTGLS